MVKKAFFSTLILLTNQYLVYAQQLMVAGQSSQLDIRQAGENSLRITLKPLGYSDDLPTTPALAERKYAAPAVTLKSNNALKKVVGNFRIEVAHKPLNIAVSDKQGRLIQKFVFNNNGTLSFLINDEPLLGLGEGGSKPPADVDWRKLAVEYDRRGRYDSMQPRWQRDAYGSRNPVPMIVGTSGWATFVASPWVQVDLSDKSQGLFIPWKQLKKM